MAAAGLAAAATGLAAAGACCVATGVALGFATTAGDGWGVATEAAGLGFATTAGEGCGVAAVAAAGFGPPIGVPPPGNGAPIDARGLLVAGVAAGPVAGLVG